MCGIVGKYYYKNQDKQVDEELIKAMCAQILHRGPDGEGTFVSGALGIGMRRLSIIDVEGGNQPISNEDRSIWVMQNGEIYNYQILKRELEDKGHFFKTASDTEVIAHSYEEYGLDFVKRLRGMFSIAVWDRKYSRLILARDRFGKKPLYFYEKNGTFWFASEIKSILVDPDVDKIVNPAALDLYLSYQYVPAPMSIFDKIFKVPPATVLIIEKGRISSQTYWNLNHIKSNSLSEDDCIEGIRERMAESVKLRLISDVPLGAFLSGGVDSSIVVGVMSAISDSPIKTFSIGFEEDAFNELPFARQIATLFGTDHHEHIVKQDLRGVLPQIVWHYGEPFGDSSAIPTFHLARITKRDVKVALCGDGGDELFAGYQKYPIYEKKIRRSQLQKWLGNATKRLLENVPIRTLGLENLAQKVYKSLYVRACGVEDRDYIWMTYYDELFKERLYSPQMASSVYLGTARQYYDQQLDLFLDKNVINQILKIDLHNYLPDDLLAKVDIASMANSLEVRSPFLDQEFAEFVASIPTSLKIKNGTTKYILKKAYSSMIPANILNREKRGFAIPIDTWFRGELMHYAREIFEGHGRLCVEKYFNPQFIYHMMKVHAEGKAEYGSKLWLVLMFVLWHMVYIENKSIS